MAYSSIAKPTDYFNTILWTGNGADGRALTGVGFQPDWVWIKNRDTASNHSEYDVIRTATKRLRPNLTNAEDTKSNGLQSFDSDGFTVGDSTVENNSGDGIVAWNWLAANGTASNGDGSITSTVSANTTAGFSIVSYTGTGSNATVGHGLGAAPSYIIIKDRDNSRSWIVGSDGIGWGNYMSLDGTDASTSLSSIWNSTAPTSTVFSVGTAANTNNSGSKLIAYCFAEKKGYCKVGTYTGNGNADGTFVYTGFKPAWIMLKKSTASGTSWIMFDNKRATYNPAYNRLHAELTDAEYTTAYGLDMLSNGFKLITSDSSFNNSGDTYIYMAFAENPFVANDSGTAVPVVAR